LNDDKKPKYYFSTGFTTFEENTFLNGNIKNPIE